VAPNLPSQIDLSQAGNEDGHAAEGVTARLVWRRINARPAAAQ
jgi:hypothetical protein